MTAHRLRGSSRRRTTAFAVLGAMCAASTVARSQTVPHTHADTAAMHMTNGADSMPMPSMGTSMSGAPLGIAMQRMGSGTSWLPDASPMHASHSILGQWDVMLHGVAFLQYDDQGSKRGDRQLGSVNWGMAMASRDVGGGRVMLRAMSSAEPFTIGARGYPLLLQSGEAYHGQPLHDRQHPHDLFMEIAASYDHAISRDVAMSLYVAPVGEPAVGPVAFPHRPSAMNDPLAPLGHHWQDATHVTFGVLTAGVYTRAVRVEASLFNGREPDEIRTNFDYRGRRLDSYAGRVTVNPSERLSLSASYAFLASPEALSPDESLHRISASVLFDRPLSSVGRWSSALVYGANAHAGHAHLANSVLAESNLELDARNTVFGRAEVVEKSAGELDVVSPPVLDGPGQPRPFGFTSETRFSVGQLTLGYVRELAVVRGGSLGLGAAGTINAIPEALRSVYGSRIPVGASVFLRIRPGLMRMSAHPAAGAAHRIGEMCAM